MYVTNIVLGTCIAEIKKKITNKFYGKIKWSNKMESND